MLRGSVNASVTAKHIIELHEHEFPPAQDFLYPGYSSGSTVSGRQGGEETAMLHPIILFCSHVRQGITHIPQTRPRSLFLHQPPVKSLFFGRNTATRTTVAPAMITTM